MPSLAPFSGVIVPALTPFTADLAADATTFAAHCRWLLDEGADGLAVFGTTGEANSLGASERMAMAEALVDAGIDPAVLMSGTGCCALPDSVALTRHAVELGCGGVLMLPPFYYKDVGEEGLFRAFAEVIDRVGDDRMRVYLYHIPPVAHVPVAPALVARLAEAFPGIIAGVKDSSGDFDNTRRLIEAVPGLAIFPGSETHFLAGLRAGGAGGISAAANVNVRAVRRLIDTWNDQASDADDQQASLTAVRTVFQGTAMIPALKAVAAVIHGDTGWRRTRPPLMPLDDEAANAPIMRLAAAGFVPRPVADPR